MEAFVMMVLAIAGGALAIGGLIGALIVIPIMIYSFPYMCWLGWNKGTKGIPRKLESEGLSPKDGFLLYAQNATKLYRSWITKKPHGITKF